MHQLTFDTIQDTQRAAWTDLQDKLGDRQRRVLKAIQAAPRTLAEIASALNVPINCVSGRVRELCQAGAVEDSGQRRKNPDSGKANIVWQAKTELQQAA